MSDVLLAQETTPGVYRGKATLGKYSFQVLVALVTRLRTSIWKSLQPRLGEPAGHGPRIVQDRATSVPSGDSAIGPFGSGFVVEE
jgi:hypothetical protein